MTRHGSVSTKDIDALISGATPQFSMQLHARLAAMLTSLAPDDPVRGYGEDRLKMLERLAFGTTRGGHPVAEPPPEDEGWSAMPSHPAETGV